MQPALIVTMRGDVVTMTHDYTLKQLEDEGEKCVRQVVELAAETYHFDTVRQVCFYVLQKPTAKNKDAPAVLVNKNFKSEDLNLLFFRVYRRSFTCTGDKRHAQLNEIFRSFSRKACEIYIRDCGVDKKELYILFDEGDE